MSNSKEYFSVPEEQIRQITQNKQSPDKWELTNILAKSLEDEITLDEVNKLINVLGLADFEEVQAEIIKLAKNIRNNIFNGSVVAMAPIELGNICASNCDFCGWRSDNKEMERSRTPNELALAQAKYLIDKGIYSIEYVCGDDPKMIKNSFPELISETRKLFPKGVQGKIQICTMALTEKHYKKLKEAGADGIIMWQETYDKKVYDQHITHGPKAFGINDNWNVRKNGDGFNFRLQSQDRALEAGLEVSLGSMLGLNSDINYEVISTIMHARHLIENRGVNEKNPLIIGMPTWNKITTPDTDNRPHEYHEVNPYFAYIAALYFLSIPKKKAWIFPNCRMPLDVQIEALQAGGVYTSTEVKLGPAGYIPQMLREAQNKGDNDYVQHISRLVSQHMKINFDSLNELENKLDHQEQFQHHYHTHQEYVDAFHKAGLHIVPKTYITPDDALENLKKYNQINVRRKMDEAFLHGTKRQDVIDGQSRVMQ